MGGGAGKIHMDDGCTRLGVGKFVVAHFLCHRARVKGRNIWIGLIFHVDDADRGQKGKDSGGDRDNLGLAYQRRHGDEGGEEDVPRYLPVTE